MDRIAPYTRPLEDAERAFLIRQALAHAAIAQARREEAARTPLTDEKLDEVLARVTPPVLLEVSDRIRTGSAIGKTVRTAVSGGLLPKGRTYTDEELEL
jgi:hypothetical protein